MEFTGILVFVFIHDSIFIIICLNFNREIDAVSANDILFKSSPRKHHNLPAHIAATPPDPSSSSDENASIKVNGFETNEVLLLHTFLKSCLDLIPTNCNTKQIQHCVLAKETVQLAPRWFFERVVPVRHNNVPSHI